MISVSTKMEERSRKGRSANDSPSQTCRRSSSSIRRARSSSRDCSEVTSSESRTALVELAQDEVQLIFSIMLCRRTIADIFRIQVVSNPDVRSPIITLGSTSFFHVRHENLYVVAVTKCNANAALVFEFCYRIIQIGRSYFGKFDEESVKNNFVLFYELLDGESTILIFSLFLRGEHKCSCFQSCRGARLRISTK